MLRNSSHLFVHQCMKSKFMDTLEGVLTSPRTSPIVRERLLDVLAAAAYASSATPSKNESRFRVLWRKVKPAGKPDEGVPFGYDDSIFNPPSPRWSSTFNPTPTLGYQPPVYPQVLQVAPVPNTQPQAPPPPQPQSQSQQPQPQPQTQAPPQSTRARRNGPNQGQLQRIIPPDEDILFQECRFASGNAQIFSEALAFPSPEDLREKEIINCLISQELIAAQIPWATAGADRSRATREAQQQGRTIKRQNSPNGLNVSVLTKHSRHKQGSEDESPIELTPEEKLLGALLEANEALTSILRMHDEVEQIGIGHQALERSRQEVRLDRSVSHLSHLLPS
ncbi:hypothetical protein BJV78DRAFT_1176277 [Lactifluus subvellereus]|nr:hypothetical protein BJV78DRAFT_1176277 [Lactifluus subvellereus]